MQTSNNVHQQFASFFKSEKLKPYAYLVAKKLSEGHICLNLDELGDEPADPSFYDQKEVLANQDVLANEPLVTSNNGPKQPFVLHNRKLYLHRYFTYETGVLEQLKSFAVTNRRAIDERYAMLEEHADFIRALFSKQPVTRSNTPVENIDWQLIAAVSALLNNFTIITGGPGTGKTTTVARILAILYTANPALKVSLAAPTGKAAARMSDSLKNASTDVPEKVNALFETITPGTIHRLLKYRPDSLYFRHNKDNPVNYDVVIVDEASMIDVALFAKLVSAIGPDTKLILLGDKDQLASVEAGSIFGDLCKAQPSFSISRKNATVINSLITEPSRHITADFISENDHHLLSGHVVELKRSHRFNSDQGIGMFSKAIITGNQEKLNSFLQSNAGEQVTIDTVYDERLFEDIIEGYASYIQEPDILKALKLLNTFRVLCAIREGEHGLHATNRKIEKYLQQKKLIRPASEFYEHRPVIVTKNHCDLNLFNGDVGIIRRDENNVLKAWFEDSSGALKSVLPGFISEAETVFAMTIHKSQGSEYDHVLVVLPDRPDMPLLTAELLYTGVTRAKLKVMVQAPAQVITEIAKRRVKRASAIMERLEEIAGH